jgi:hypothetical protein
MKEKLTELEGEIDNATIIVGDIYLLSLVSRKLTRRFTKKQKMSITAETS